MYDVAVIGAGPTGGSAALFAAKAGKKTVVFDNGKSITTRAWMENHYGVKELSGPDMIKIGKEQVLKFGGNIVEATVENIEKSENGFILKTDNRDFTAKHVIFATGLSVDLAEKIGLKLKDGTEPRVKTIIDVDSYGRTNIDGIWAAGMGAGKGFHTIITAGDGANVAVNVISELNGQRYVDHDVLK
ncbi:FAD-dependent oxidoreductase [Bacillus aquiflavi]|uniref:FAD-dependent oxidoreductase n=1 Tax=Bacillus aquiflavi TaxID=2672567 RepID=A0A6B3VSG2_9BACI|nr:NAD(P)/FAD-dependent oxidoreductase [Bacillus aquiflavi]MBA4535782.1 FAD-dependent oxidoreductase [Bacillus aquiflavi]NEY80158.1 FAD-dependent oxidoreductase [Bacillus aquiflavi]UAC47212.1 FAD-dependent oxidoreductase [Bacillus aquiflavi]